MTARTCSATRVLFAFVLTIATATSARGDIGIVALEPIRALGYLTRVGHAATYLSNICPDGSPVRMRLCTPGEGGGVVSRYSGFSEQEDYDWAIVSFEAFLHGVESAELAPMIATQNLREAIERHNFERLFADALRSTDGQPPRGQWKTTLANRFGRSLYVFSVATTPEDDAAIVAAFNDAPNISQFNFFYVNCSDQTKAIFNLVFQRAVGDRLGGITMETPKGLVKTLVSYAQNHPELTLSVRRFPQIPGTFNRSREILFPMENMYRSTAFAPYWVFGGYREVAVAAMFYHQVISPFSLTDATRAFVSPRAAQLTVEQRRLRQQQDVLARALASATDGANWSGPAGANARLVERLDQIQTEQRAEVRRVAGSKADWRERGEALRSLVGTLASQPLIPDEVKGAFDAFDANGHLSETLLRYFEARGDFSVDVAGRGPWISLPLGDGGRSATGLSRAEVLSGDPIAAVLVLAAAIDYNVHHPRDREDIARVDEMFTLFKRAVEALTLAAGGQELQEP